MKSTFLLRLIPGGASKINEATDSLTFTRQADTSPETAIVNFNGIVEHCPIGSVSSHHVGENIENLSADVSLSTGIICIHLIVTVENQNLTSAVGGIVKYRPTPGDAVTLMTVHGHLLPHADDQTRAGDRHGGNLDGEASNDTWEGNTGW